MVAYYFNTSSSFGSGYTTMLDPFSSCLDSLRPVLQGGSAQALVLDIEKGELVKAPAARAKKGMSEVKILAALKSHSEAERRRRERINAHLDTLRGLVPCTEKMDKATLLAEVINQVKQLKQDATEASEGLIIPMDEDELEVEPCEPTEHETWNFKATLCCDYRAELLCDIKQAIDALDLKIVNAEISTLSGRLKTVLFLSSLTNVKKDPVIRQAFAGSIHQALCSAIEKSTGDSPEYSPRTILSNKRRKVSFFESSCSSL